MTGNSQCSTDIYISRVRKNLMTQLPANSPIRIVNSSLSLSTCFSTLLSPHSSKSATEAPHPNRRPRPRQCSPYQP